MAADSTTGKAGGFSFLGVQLVFTKWTASGKKQMAKSTDSSNYDAATKQLWTSQLPGEQNQEVSVEGNWSRANTPPNLIASLKSDPPVACVLSIDALTSFCSGNYDLSEFEAVLEVPEAKTFSFTAKLMSNGKVTYS